ncbi:MAG: 23S rRNA (guanosine(2251)-2'-O)-methyltransferase RlmB [Muribaculaceae bacterium]|nr:23S rRNA (guanosine(2251)-2'-O)-methyltransferase RlmB [Muribaculaceae bacterium]MEE1339135.1 23S rRNA (guanosine(2251)-2'-O)-methyltransferase RlmB [Muribaculaceae bacterium]
MMDKNDYIFGIRPVIEAIEAGKDIDKILVKKDLSGELINELYDLVKEYKILIQRVPLEKINRITRKNHQGVLAILSSVTYSNISNVIPEIYESGNMPFLVALDGVTDVRNFGAIARTCECAGVDAIVIPERHSVSVSGDAMKTSAGALNYVQVCRERSMVGALNYLKANGCKIVGASGKTKVSYTDVDYSVPTVIVMGAEDKGLEPEVEAVCDELVTIPEYGKINSLNVSVAAGILMYEVVRQRNKK